MSIPKARQELLERIATYVTSRTDVKDAFEATITYYLDRQNYTLSVVGTGTHHEFTMDINSDRSLSFKMTDGKIHDIVHKGDVLETLHDWGNWADTLMELTGDTMAKQIDASASTHNLRMGLLKLLKPLSPISEQLTNIDDVEYSFDVDDYTVTLIPSGEAGINAQISRKDETLYVRAHRNRTSDVILERNHDSELKTSDWLTVIEKLTDQLDARKDDFVECVEQAVSTSLEKQLLDVQQLLKHNRRHDGSNTNRQTGQIQI